MIEYKSRSDNFSLTLVQMCSYAVIAQVGDADETLGQLILHFLAVRPNEKVWNVSELTEKIDNLFGLQLREYQVQNSLDWLVRKGHVQRPANNNFILTAHDQERLQKRIDEARALENKVKQEWLEEVLTNYSKLSPNLAWEALQAYVAKAFLSHGIQSVALWNPSITIANEYSESLSLLLNGVLAEKFPPELQEIASKAISNFFVEVGDHPERAKYFTQLGDGAFNYFSLMVAPNIASQFRKKLSHLTLFLDTNFLLGILDLHINPFIEVSKELLRVATQKFPTTEDFRLELRYHQATEQELRSTIAYYGAKLRSKVWSQEESGTIINSPYLSEVRARLSGIEKKYHRLNAEVGVDVNSFLKVFEHVDVLLKEKGIHVYKPQVESENDELLDKYRDFLGGKNKPYKALKHDITVLNTVYQLRTKTDSSLEVGAIFITCDYYLYKFDLEISRSHGDASCVVLPHHFLQVLRPFITTDTDFDRSFAATFAIPEFRSMDSDVLQACSKSVGLIASYKSSSVSENTAEEIITQSLLKDGLRFVSDNKQFQESIEQSILNENAHLLEERVGLAMQLKEYEKEKIRAEQLLRQKDEQLKHFKMISIATEKKKPNAEFLEKMKADEKKQAKQARDNAKMEKRAREDAERQLAKTERIANIYKTTVAFMLSGFAVTIFELFIYQFHWQWLIENRNGYSLQAIFDLILVLLIFSVFLQRWRRWFLSGGGLFAILLVVIQILGGSVK